MPLDNHRHEQFVQELASGKGMAEAYRAAGYAGTGRNAARIRARPEVAARLAELQARSAEKLEITVQKLTEMFLADWEKARALKQMGAAVSALEKVGKLHGLFVDRSLNQNTHYVIAHEPVRDPEAWLAKHRAKAN